jgi:hypothetical protein
VNVGVFVIGERVPKIELTTPASNLLLEGIEQCSVTMDARQEASMNQL